MSRARRTVHPATTAGLLGLSALSAAGAYLTYARPVPEPTLSAEKLEGVVQVGTLERRYLAVIPEHLPVGAPLVLMFHGSGQKLASMRAATGYRMDELAAQHGFALVYLEAHRGRWQSCFRAGAPRDPAPAPTRPSRACWGPPTANWTASR